MMATQHSTAIPITNDPVPSATAALSSAGAALKGAAGEMADQVTGFLPAAGSFLSQAVYTGCYCVSYGVTFPTVFLVNVIPGGIPLAAGIADGARSARNYVRGVRDRSAANQQTLDEPLNEAHAAMKAPAGGTPGEAAPRKRAAAAAKKGRTKTPPPRKKNVPAATRPVKKPGKRSKPGK
jgi:hypothetical protein